MAFYRDVIAPRLTHFGCGSGRIRTQRSLIAPAAEGVVVEVGIGSAHNLALYRKDRVRQVIGIEPQVAMIRLGAANVAASPVPVQIAQGVAEALPLDDNVADCAVLTFTLCSVQRADTALAEIRRVLKPAGRLLVLEHGLSDDPGVARWQRRIDPVWTRLAAGCHINRPVNELVERSGFAFSRRQMFYLPGAPRLLGWLTRGIAVSR